MGRQAKIPSFRLFGGKSYLADWITKYFPSHSIYVEPFGGAASVLLNKPPSKTEIYCDINYKFVAILEEIKNNCEEFLYKLWSIPYSRDNFDKAKFNNANVVDWLIIQRWSRSGMGRDFSWGKTRTRGGQPESINAWHSFLKAVPKISERLKNVRLFTGDYKSNLDFFSAICRREETFWYLDPPYLPKTRSAKKVYEYDMDESDHERLLRYCLDKPEKILISGYASDLYNDMLKGWTVASKSIANNACQGKKLSRRVECLWFNY